MWLVRKSGRTVVIIGACCIAFSLAIIAFYWFSCRPVRVFSRAVQSLDPKRDKEKLEELYLTLTEADHQLDWKMPIAFYGKVVDEHGDPVSGAEIEFCWTDISREGTSKSRTQSDAQGLFSLVGVHGKNLGVQVKKDGYHTLRESNRFSFEYANVFNAEFHKPDPKQPVLFYVRRRPSTEPLIYRHIRMSIKNDGTPVRLNLLSGKRADDGQIEFRKWKSEERDGLVFDWRAELRVLDGGFIETNMDFLGEAPVTGYVPEIHVSFSRSARAEWRQIVDKFLYIAFGTPKRYARAKISIAGVDKLVFLDLWINPSGSRTLEYDRDKDITHQFDKQKAMQPPASLLHITFSVTEVILSIADKGFSIINKGCPSRTKACP
jgi:hypothetical protein